MRPGWKVAGAGLGLNLSLGVPYAWSLFGKQLSDDPAHGGYGWSQTAATLPYTVAIVCLAAAMAPGGRLQDRFGPRIVAAVGGMLAATGLFVSGFASPHAILPVVLGFGVLCGTGIGLGYAAATPAAVKWFPPGQTGIVTGVVVAGFGLAPVYIAPLARYLLADHGIAAAFRTLGLICLVFALTCAGLLRTPADPAAQGGRAPRETDHSGWRILREGAFYRLFFQFGALSLGGLMVIGHLARIVLLQSGGRIRIGFAFVALLAVFNAGGRVIAGAVSDRIGRNATIAIACFTQAINLWGFRHYATVAAFAAGTAVTGISYGANSSLFAASAADRWGRRNFGFNYGLLFTAWGVAGVFGPMLAGRMADTTGSYAGAYALAAEILAAAGLVSWFPRPARALVSG